MGLWHAQLERWCCGPSVRLLPLREALSAARERIALSIFGPSLFRGLFLQAASALAFEINLGRLGEFVRGQRLMVRRFVVQNLIERPHIRSLAACTAAVEVI